VTKNKLPHTIYRYIRIIFNLHSTVSDYKTNCNLHPLTQLASCANLGIIVLQSTTCFGHGRPLSNLALNYYYYYYYSYYPYYEYERTVFYKSWNYSSNKYIEFIWHCAVNVARMREDKCEWELGEKTWRKGSAWKSYGYIEGQY
jgi:hypothetical protein